MSIRTKQIENTLEDIVRLLFAQGVKPSTTEILKLVSEYFSRYPAGLPVPLPLSSIRDGARSDVHAMNEIMATVGLNLDVAYDVSQEHVHDVMEINSQLQADIQRLRSRRQKLEALIDDYLLGLYNSDGYFYSISDVFSTLSKVDLALSTAYVDTQEGFVRLPTVSNLSSKLDLNLRDQPTVSMRTAAGVPVQFRTISPWSGAVDGLSNTLWAVEASLDNPQDLVLQLVVPLSASSPTLSRLDLDPHGISEAQYIVRVGVSKGGSVELQSFGDRIITTSEKFSLIDEPIEAESLDILIRKPVHDYVDSSGGSVKYKYVFGIKDLVLTRQVYDNTATMVTKQLSIPDELEGQLIIDAVSVVTDATSPADTKLTYYVAEDVEGATSVSDFQWKSITPLDVERFDAIRVVRFNGSKTQSKKIVSNPAPNDLLLIPPDTSNADLTKRNPSPAIIPGTSTWRIAAFTDQTILANSIRLEEGVNTVRFYETAYDPLAVTGLAWWADKFDALTPHYSRIDLGNGFFYGGDVGESFRSVYVETYIDMLEADTVLAEFRKDDSNATAWDVRVYLNGRDVGFLPVGVDRLIVPYAFQAGLNHIAVLVNIPAGTTAIPNPYVGTIDLMGTAQLQDQGTVRLASWSYVDLFDLKFNHSSQSRVFTIHNGEIISRRQPTTNFRMTYASETGSGPTAIRLRADLSRGSDHQSLSPTLSSYRLRFSYGD